MPSDDVHTEEPVKADQPLRLLIVNKNDAGAELIVQELKRAGSAVTFVRVENLDAFASRLQEEAYDLVLSGHSLHDRTGMDALNVVTKSAKNVPFIVIISSLGDAGGYGRGGPTSTPFSHLTPRQREIAILVGRGQSNRDVAKCLSVGEQVVKNHLRSIYRELHVANRTELVVWLNKQRPNE